MASDDTRPRLEPLRPAPTYVVHKNSIERGGAPCPSCPSSPGVYAAVAAAVAAVVSVPVASASALAPPPSSPAPTGPDLSLSVRADSVVATATLHYSGARRPSPWPGVTAPAAGPAHRTRHFPASRCPAQEAWSSSTPTIGQRRRPHQTGQRAQRAHGPRAPGRHRRDPPAVPRHPAADRVLTAQPLRQRPRGVPRNGRCSPTAGSRRPRTGASIGTPLTVAASASHSRISGCCRTARCRSRRRPVTRRGSGTRAGKRTRPENDFFNFQYINFEPLLGSRPLTLTYQEKFGGDCRFQIRTSMVVELLKPGLLGGPVASQ